jgi:uncharacterized lipoprotein YbaY
LSRQADVALVTGQLVISTGTPPFRDGTAHVCLEDISYADAAALVVADSAIPGVSHDPSATGGRDTVIPFTLRARPSSPIVPRNDYAVRAWIDRDGDGQLGGGDLCSDQIYRVLTGGFGSAITIPLQTC